MYMKRLRVDARVILTLLMISALPLAPVASADTVVISGSMEGNLPINPGDTVKAGFDFILPGDHPATTIMVSNIRVQIFVTCPNQTNETININIPNQTFNVAKGFNDWIPSANQSSPLVYQGSTKATTCAGGHAPKGATFMATFTSTKNCVKVNTRFHYSDNSAGSWSATVTAIGSKECSSSPCKCEDDHEED
jgi:hypothetical protein